MAEHAVLRVLVYYWAVIVAALNPATSERLRGLASNASHHELSDRDRAEISDRIEELLIEELPADHPARVELRSHDTLLYADGGEAAPTSEVDLLAALSARLIAEPDDPNELLLEVERRLLAEPALSKAAVRSAGQDPAQPNLVRLAHPDGTVVLPAFQFDPDVRPHPVVLQVNETLNADGDPWGVASWWLGKHSWLAAKPAELIGQDQDDKLLTAARAERED